MFDCWWQVLIVASLIWFCWVMSNQQYWQPGCSLAHLLRIVVEIRWDAEKLWCVSPMGLVLHNHPTVCHHCWWIQLWLQVALWTRDSREEGLTGNANKIGSPHQGSWNSMHWVPPAMWEFAGTRAASMTKSHCSNDYSCCPERESLVTPRPRTCCGWWLRCWSPFLSLS